MPPVEPSTDLGDLDLHDHACWVSQPDAAHRSALVRYLTAGLVRRERVGFFGAPRQRIDDVAADLSAIGVPVGRLTEDGQLVLASAEDQYVRDGTFDARRRLRDYTVAVRGALDDGYRGFRVAADVAWLADHPQARHDWPGYEFAADLLAARLPFTALCVYEPRHWHPAELGVVEALHSRRVGGTVTGADTGFRARADRDGSIRLLGELDITHSARLRQILDVAARHSGVAVLDVSGLDFVDVSGMRAIAVTCAAMARTRGDALIRGTSGRFRRIWDLAGFGTVDTRIRVE